MMENAFAWEEVELKRAKSRSFENIVVLVNSDNSVRIARNLTDDAGWDLHTGKIRVSLYRHGKTFMFKPNKAGSITFVVPKVTNKETGERVFAPGAAIITHNLELKLTLLTGASSDARFEKKVVFKAYTEDDGIIFRCEDE